MPYALHCVPVRSAQIYWQKSCLRNFDEINSICQFHQHLLDQKSIAHLSARQGSISSTFYGHILVQKCLAQLFLVTFWLCNFLAKGYWQKKRA